MEAAESRKRLLEDDNSNDKQQTAPYHLKQPPSVNKRRNVSDVKTITTFPTKPPCFLVFHFKMLKSLYDDDDDKRGENFDNSFKGTFKLLLCLLWLVVVCSLLLLCCCGGPFSKIFDFLSSFLFHNRGSI